MMTLENGKELCLKQKVIDLKYSIYISIIMIKILSCILRSYIQCSQKNKHIYGTDYKQVSYIRYFQSFVLDYKLNCNSAGKTSNQNKILKEKRFFFKKFKNQFDYITITLTISTITIYYMTIKSKYFPWDLASFPLYFQMECCMMWC